MLFKKIQFGGGKKIMGVNLDVIKKLSQIIVK